MTDLSIRSTHHGRPLVWALGLVLLAAVVLPMDGMVSPAGSAAAAAPVPGVTATSISVGQVDTLSGPVPGLFLGAKDGTAAYFAYVNSHGGVDGRKIKLDVQDDAFSAANNATETQQEVTKDFALVGGFSLFDNAGVPAINSAKIPDITMSLSKARSLDPYNYAPDPLIVGGAGLGNLTYFKRTYPNAIKHVGTLVSNVATAEVQSDAVYSAMQTLGYHIDYRRDVTPFELDFLPDVLKMQAAGVQMVYIVGLAVNQIAGLATAMRQEGFTPQVFTTSGAGYDSNYIKDAGLAANGTYTSLPSALFLGQDASHVPAVALFDKWVRRVNPSAPVDLYALYGWVSAQLFVQALRASGTQLSRASLLTSLNHITSFDADRLIAPGNPAQKTPEQCWILARVVSGNWVRTRPTPPTGYICNPGGFYYPTGYKPLARPGA